MTVASTTSKVRYVASGGVTAFPVTFRFTDPEDLLVYLVPPGGGETLLELGTGYTVSAPGNDYGNGGTVTLAATPVDDSIVLVLRLLPLLQQIDLTNNGKMPGEVLETGYDRLVMISQQIKEEIDRCLKMPVTSSADATPDAYMAALQSAAADALQSSAAAAVAQSAAEAAQTASEASAAEAAATLASKQHIAFYVATAEGLDNTGTNDCTAAFNTLVAKCNTNNIHRIHFPAGNYRFASAPTAFATGIILTGEGASATVIVRDFTPGGISEPLFSWTASSNNGGGAEDLEIYAAPGTSHGKAILLLASATHAPDFSNFRNVVVTGGGTWYLPIHVDGSLRVTGAKGVRDVLFENVTIFNTDSANGCLYVNNGDSIRFMGGGVFTGGGVNANVSITGGGTSLSNSIHVRIDSNIEGTVALDNCSDVEISGRANAVTTTSNVSIVSVTGVVASLTNNMTADYIIATHKQLSMSAVAAKFAKGYWSNSLVIGDDAVGYIDFGGTKSGVAIIYNTNNADVRGVVRFRVGSAPAVDNIAIPNASLVCTTGAMTGTTGTDTTFSVSAHTDNKLYFENRLGGARSIYLAFMGDL